MFTAPVLLSEKDFPGANLHGRKPAEMKKANLLFWLRCRGDSCKGMAIKAQLAKQYACIELLLFFYKRFNRILYFFFTGKQTLPEANMSKAM